MKTISIPQVPQGIQEFLLLRQVLFEQIQELGVCISNFLQDGNVEKKCVNQIGQTGKRVSMPVKMIVGLTNSIALNINKFTELKTRYCSTSLNEYKNDFQIETGKIDRDFRVRLISEFEKLKNVACSSIPNYAIRERDFGYITIPLSPSSFSRGNISQGNNFSFDTLNGRKGNRQNRENKITGEKIMKEVKNLSKMMKCVGGIRDAVEMMFPGKMKENELTRKDSGDDLFSPANGRRSRVRFMSGSKC